MIFKDIDEISAECARLRTEEKYDEYSPTKNIQHYFIMAKKPPCECIVITSRKLYELLSNASVAIDAEPVRHGHWIVHENKWASTNECSECHAECMIDGNYCPNCGAKMDEGK